MLNIYRSNHLGNTNRGGQTSSYRWTLPHFPSGKDKRCVLRIRYNISTADYNSVTTDHTNNQQGDVQSPIQGDPAVTVVNGMPDLRLAINTAQFGRVFQDRSHIFKLRPRQPAGIDGSAKLYNMNVRGKRGNIVQAFPAVEYDFAPNELRIKQGDLVHFQWTGSNTHRNGNNAAGEGRQGTDRHNVVEMLARKGNFPVAFEDSTMWDAVQVVWIYHGQKNLPKSDVAINMASSGYYQCSSQQKCGQESVDRKPKLSDVLDNAPASYEGVVLRFTKKGTYHFLCTRNNSFSNRSQKAAIVVQ
ncbi:protein DD3-3-like [Elysia marginata]|uniref:Protein DD3-3-like n=1 Tax=Elysia marginata TaxID=1093978 RepID=A0AAV4FCB5_9GAST|nr:protein DD3-3-like [Elysia marginata]